MLLLAAGGGEEGGRDETPCHPVDRGCEERGGGGAGLTGGVRREGDIVAFPFSFRQHPMSVVARRKQKSRSFVVREMRSWRSSLGI